MLCSKSQSQKTSDVVSSTEFSHHRTSKRRIVTFFEEERDNDKIVYNYIFNKKYRQLAIEVSQNELCAYNHKSGAAAGSKNSYLKPLKSATHQKPSLKLPAAKQKTRSTGITRTNATISEAYPPSTSEARGKEESDKN